MQEIDIWRTAAFLLREYGVEAGLVAAKRAETLLAQGDQDGCAVWVSIWRSIDTLRRKPREGEVLN